MYNYFDQFDSVDDLANTLSAAAARRAAEMRFGQEPSWLPVELSQSPPIGDATVPATSDAMESPGMRPIQSPSPSADPEIGSGTDQASLSGATSVRLASWMTRSCDAARARCLATTKFPQWCQDSWVRCKEHPDLSITFPGGIGVLPRR